MAVRNSTAILISLTRTPRLRWGERGFKSRWGRFFASPSRDFWRGWDRQYASGDYQALLQEHEIIPSMSRKGDCWDNAVTESFSHTLKGEGHE